MHEFSISVKMNSPAAINVEKSMFHTSRLFVLQDARVQNALFKLPILGPGSYL